MVQLYRFCTTGRRPLSPRSPAWGLSSFQPPPSSFPTACLPQTIPFPDSTQRTSMHSITYNLTTLEKPHLKQRLLLQWKSCSVSLVWSFGRSRLASNPTGLRRVCTPLVQKHVSSIWRSSGLGTLGKNGGRRWESIILNSRLLGVDF